jgi:transposase InsO family protein
MPWEETSPMLERMAFIVEYEKGNFSVAALCRMFAVSEKTGYKWISRWKLCRDPLSLRDQSRSPHNSPNRTSEDIERRILELRCQYPDMGPMKIVSVLGLRDTDFKLPAPSTVGEILKRNGLVAPRKIRRRATPTPSPFPAHPQANDTWGLDYKGWWRMLNTRVCYPLTVTDLSTRYLIVLRGMPNEQLVPTKALLQRAFREYGMPNRIRSDNGPPFGSTGIAGLSQLSVWFMRHGIEPERITPGKPQQNGSHERMHLTLKQYLKHLPAASNLSAQQQQLNEFRQYFNQVRPHQALNQVCPCELYGPSPRQFPERLPEQQHPPGSMVRTVSNGGNFSLLGQRFFIGRVLDGNQLSLLPNEADKRLMEVWFTNLRLGFIDTKRLTFRQAVTWREAVQMPA